VQPSYPEFRRRLDDVLRKRDPAALRAFLVAEGEWQADTTTDPEWAMWMMIATSPGLAELHDEAIHWLNAHGHASEASLFGRRERGRPPGRRPAPSHGRGGGSRTSHGKGQGDSHRPHRP
jgi:hypothetical protein